MKNLKNRSQSKQIQTLSNKIHLFLKQKSPTILGLFLFFNFSVSCTPTQKLTAKPAIKVNDRLLTTKEFADQLAKKLKNYESVTAKDPNAIFHAKEEIINDFVIRSLSLDWAKEKEIIITEHDLDKEVDRLRANYPDDLSFRRSLAQENISFSDWREQLRYILIQKAVFKNLTEKIQVPTETEILSYYNSNKEKYKQKETILLRQIVVDDPARLEAIKNELKKTPFSDLAKKYSITPEAKTGGQLNWIEKGSVDYFDSLFSFPVGSVQMIKSPFGSHLIKIEGKKPAGYKDLSSVRKIIISSLLGQKEQALYVGWLDVQLRKSKILKDYDLINSIVVDTRGKND